MTVLNLQVNASGNDVKVFGGWQPTAIDCLLGRYADATSGSAWFRWTGVTVPQGSTISSAVLTIRQRGGVGSGTTVLVKSQFTAEDNATMPADETAANARTRTTATGTASWTVNYSADEIDTIDVAAACQEVINRAGWASGNALLNRVGDNGNANFNYIGAWCYDGSSTDAAKLDITYLNPAPTVSNVSANSGPAAGGTNVTITGTGFSATPTITFGGTSATNVVFVNSTTLTCTTPAHAAGAVNVVVTNPDTQTGTGTNAFTYVAAPTVSSVSANSGSISGGTNVTVTGTGFLANPTSVTFGGSAATNVVRTNSTTITCTTPSHAAGAVDVVVTNSDAQAGTGTNVFTFVAAPTVSGVSASSGSTAGGTAVTVSGTGFVATPTITFGGDAATGVAFVNSTTLTCTTPAHAAGAVDVVVTNPDTQTGTGAGAFTYTAPASNPTAPLSAGLPKIDQSFRSFNAGQGGFF